MKELKECPLAEQPAVVTHNAIYPQWASRNMGDMTRRRISACCHNQRGHHGHYAWRYKEGGSA
jgi:hypothetical protein